MTQPGRPAGASKHRITRRSASSTPAAACSYRGPPRRPLPPDALRRRDGDRPLARCETAPVEPAALALQARRATRSQAMTPPARSRPGHPARPAVASAAVGLPGISAARPPRLRGQPVRALRAGDAVRGAATPAGCRARLAPVSPGLAARRVAALCRPDSRIRSTGDRLRAAVGLPPTARLRHRPGPAHHGLLARPLPRAGGHGVRADAAAGACRVRVAAPLDTTRMEDPARLEVVRMIDASARPPGDDPGAHAARSRRRRRYGRPDDRPPRRADGTTTPRSCRRCPRGDVARPGLPVRGILPPAPRRRAQSSRTSSSPSSSAPPRAPPTSTSPCTSTGARSSRTSAGRPSGSSSRRTAPSGHSGDLAKEDDATRQALLESFGERVLRVTWTQAVTKPTQTIERLQQRRPRPLASPTDARPTSSRTATTSRWTGRSSRSSSSSTSSPARAGRSCAPSCGVRRTATSSTRPSAPARSSGPCGPSRARCSSSTPTARTRTSWTPSPTSRSRSPRSR